MPHKGITIDRARPPAARTRPTLLAIAGDSAAGKSTLTRGLVDALGPERITSICTDDYHRYDREERRSQPWTPLHPACNHIEIMEQHLTLLARGEPILKPVYDHSVGRLVRPELVEPREFVIVEGLLPLHTRLARACFDVTVFLDPPEDIRHRWKIQRDCADRSYTEDEVRAELSRRQSDTEAFIRPQRAHADLVVRFAPIPERNETVDDPLSATLLLRPTVEHPDLRGVVTEDTRRSIHMKLLRDDGRPVDALHVHAYAAPELASEVSTAIWRQLGLEGEVPATLGRLVGGGRSEPLAVTQLLLLHHLLRARPRVTVPAASEQASRAVPREALVGQSA